MSVPSRALQLLGQVPGGQLLRLREPVLSQIRARRSPWKLPRVRLPDDRRRQTVLQLVINLFTCTERFKSTVITRANASLVRDCVH